MFDKFIRFDLDPTPPHVPATRVNHGTGNLNVGTEVGVVVE